MNKGNGKLMFLFLSLSISLSLSHSKIQSHLILKNKDMWHSLYLSVKEQIYTIYYDSVAIVCLHSISLHVPCQT